MRIASFSFSARATMTPPSPEPVNLAPSAPFFRAVSTKLSSRGEKHRVLKVFHELYS